MRKFGVDRVTVSTAVENYVDMLLPDSPRVARTGLAHHFDPKLANPLGENGIALHVEVGWNDYRYSALFDTGMSGTVLLHNADAMDIDLQGVDHLVISHGHPDHYGGLLPLLRMREASLPLSMNSDAFAARYLRLASGQLAPYYNHDLTETAIREAGGALVLHDEPLEIGPGIVATGCIPRTVEFEAPPSSIDGENALIRLVDGKAVPDTVPDDQAMVINVGTDGIIVLTGCSHAGIVNTIKYATEITGRSRIIAIIGGFHLGFPGTPRSKTDSTLAALHEYDVEILCPMHCTGMEAMMDIKREFPGKFLMNCTGTRLAITHGKS